MQSKQPYKILVVDKDPDTLELLQPGLVNEGYQVEMRTDYSNVLPAASVWLPDLILLEMPLTYTDALALGQQIKDHPFLLNTLLVYATSHPTEHSEIEAFDMGADGYIAKPIRPRALVGRIRSLLNRRDNNWGEGQKIVLGNITLDNTTQKIFKGVQLVQVAQKEFELLFFLAQHPNRIFNRDELIQEVWGAHENILARTIDVHIHKLREKLGDDYISTLKGLGYRLNWKMK